MKTAIKRGTILLFAVVAAFVLCTSFLFVLPVRAGINQNSPTGDGLMDGGALNEESFVIQDDGNPSAYAFVQGNSTVTGSGVFAANKKIKNTGRTADSRLTYKMDIQVEPEFCGAHLNIYPVSQKVGFFGHPDDPSKIYQTWLYEQWEQQRINVASNPNYESASKDSPKDGQIHPYLIAEDGTETQAAYNGGDGIVALIAPATMGFGTLASTAATTAGRDYFTFWIEADLNGTLTFYSGYDAHDGTTPVSKVKTFRLTNAFEKPANDETEYLFQLGFSNGAFNAIDNVSFYETHAVEGVDLDTVYCTTGFENKSDVATDTSATDDTRFLTDVATSVKYNVTDTVMNVTNPQADSRVVSTGKLSVDGSMAKTFEMTAQFNVSEIAADRKIGIAFGLKDYRDKISAPQNGASFLYLAAGKDDNAGKLMLGVVNIDSAGAQTPVGTEVVVRDAAAGDGKFIVLSIVGGANNGFTVTANTDKAEATFEELNLHGAIAVVQTGTGNVSFGVEGTLFNVTGYEFKENDGTEAVSGKFDGNWLKPDKFHQHSTTAPESHMVKSTEAGAHDLTALTVENGQVGFYGASTNTRLMFAENQYADFVLQFDYIGTPAKMKGQLGSGVNRYSPLYILFGSEEAPQQVLERTYAIGIIDGNVAHEYWWGGESVIVPRGKLTDDSVVISDSKEVAESADSIPCYKNGDGAEKEVDHYALPDLEKDGYLHSFYNRTSRVKLVVINNHAALYAAAVGDDGEIEGEYVKVYETMVANSYGYVGFGAESPAWVTIDNVAITPIEKSIALKAGLDADPKADLVADVKVADMDADVEPTAVATPVLSVNAEAKKVTWAAVEGASGYTVTVKKGTETLYESTAPQTATEFDMSSYTAEGDYGVTVKAIAADQTLHYDSTPTRVVYTVASSGGGGGDGGDGDGGGKSGCGGCGGSAGPAAAALSSLVLLCGAMLLKRK